MPAGTAASLQEAPRRHVPGVGSVRPEHASSGPRVRKATPAIPLVPLQWQAMATRRAARKKRPVPHQKTGVLGLLDWMRRLLPYFDQVILRDYSEDDARVVVFVVFDRALAPAYAKMVKRQVGMAEGQLDVRRLEILKELLEKKLANGPRLVDLELTHSDYAKEEVEDFDETDQPKNLPAGAYLFFELSRKKVAKKGTTTETGFDPASDAGAPGYVILNPDVAVWAKGDDDTELHLDPDWPTWVPNPLKSKREDATDEDKRDAEKLADLLDATCKLLRPEWPTWEKLAADLRADGHTLKGGVAITASNVRRVVIAAELLLGSKKPDFLG